jgi:cell division transport system ATP-binding protein
MQLLDKINEQRKTTVLVATHDKAIVDSMRKRVVELSSGKILRDDILGGYR